MLFHPAAVKKVEIRSPPFGNYQSEHKGRPMSLKAFGLGGTQPCKDLTVGIPPGQSDHVASLRRNKKKEHGPEVPV